MKMTLHPPFMATTNQNQWLRDEKKRTGESEASIIRSLIQAKVENK